MNVRIAMSAALILALMEKLYSHTNQKETTRDHQ